MVEHPEPLVLRDALVPDDRVQPGRLEGASPSLPGRSTLGHGSEKEQKRDKRDSHPLPFNVFVSTCLALPVSVLFPPRI